MRQWPGLLVGVLWLAWASYWVIAARDFKPVQRREPLATRVLGIAALVIAGLLIATHRWPPWLMHRLVGGGWTRYWIGVALTAGGLLFAVWARRILGANWSGTVTVKEAHELIRHGPYRLIRHPIYTGILVAFLGSGLAGGQVRGAIAFLIALIALFLKSRLEERFMLEEFGERYAAYRRESWALVPYLL